MKQTYEKLQKKHKQLPDFEELDHYFEIGDLEKDGPLLRNIKKKVAEKIQGYTDFIETVLQPEASFASMHEAKYITEKERTVAIEIYMDFMRLNRFAYETSIGEEDLKNVEFIKEAYEHYKQKKDKLKALFKFLKDTWSRKDSEKEEIEYLR